jgi:ABC-type dipeptide/oligopeptide/nickel transport system permease subunit
LSSDDAQVAAVTGLPPETEASLVVSTGVRRSPTRNAWRRLRRHRLALASLIVFLGVVVVAVFAPLVSDSSPTAMVNIPLLPPSGAHLMGTDSLGRDLWARVSYGARISLAVGIASQAIAVLIGMSVGALAGFHRGVIDGVLMRMTDMMLALPSLLFALLLLALFGSSIRVVILALGLSMWPVIARIERGQVLQVMNQEYVQAAYAIGCSPWRVLFRHVLPNTLSPVAVQATFGVSQAIFAEAFLAFLGLGAQPPTPSWGRLLTEGYEYIRTSPHLIVFPALAIAVTLLAINFIGDGLRDAFDPHGT